MRCLARSMDKLKTYDPNKILKLRTLQRSFCPKKPRPTSLFSIYAKRAAVVEDLLTYKNVMKII